MLKNKNSGFTLVELLVVISITAIVTINLLNNVLRTRLNLRGTAQIFMSDLRLAQANALASKQYFDPATGLDSHRCGYGLHMLTSSQATSAMPFPQTYYLYTTKSSPPTCNNVGFQPSDSDVISTRIIDERLELCAPATGSDPCGQNGNFPRFEDVFFLSPNGKISVGNQTCQAGNQSKAQIIIRKKGVTCPSSSCTYICVYELGRIESRTTPCPVLSC